MGGILTFEVGAGSGGTFSIGGTITGGNNNDVLFINPAGVLAQDDAFTFEAGKLTADRFETSAGQVIFPTGSLVDNNDGDGLINNYARNEFKPGPIGFGTSLTLSHFTLERVILARLDVFPAYGRIGTFTLAAGVASVPLVGIYNINDYVFLSLVTASPNTPAAVSITIIDNVGFDVASSNILDVSTYNYVIIGNGV